MELQDESALAAVHQVCFHRVAVVVAGQVKHAMRRQKLELQRERDVDTPRLPNRRVRRDHDLAQQPAGRPGQLEGKRQNVGPAPDAAMGGVEHANLTIIHDRHVDLGRGTAERLQRVLTGAPKPCHGNRHAILPVGDPDRHQGAGSGAAARWRRASCAS